MSLNKFQILLKKKTVRPICHEKHLFILEEKMGVNTVFDSSV
jgi:hypothetical protein